MNDPTSAIRAAAAGAAVLLEGLHPLKHAVRFGARVTAIGLRAGVDLEDLAASVAPDLAEHLPVAPTEIAPDVFDTLSPRPPRDGVLAVAEHPGTTTETVLRAGPGPVVVLEEPRHLGNVGAAIRVAAAAGAAGVLTTGSSDPWHPVAVRGAAGLQFALPVAQATRVPLTPRPLVALHPDGDLLGPPDLPPDALVVFGTERDGISAEVLDRADRVVRLPMRPAVSSLNLATAVAVTLYALRGLGPAPDWTVR